MGTKTRDLGLHAITFVSGLAAATSVLAGKSVDLYAAYDHLHTAAQELIAAWGLLVPIAVAGYVAFKTATTKQKILDVAADPKAPEVAAGIPPTPQVIAVANALKASPM